MTGWVLIAIALLGAGLDLEDGLQWWPVWVLLLVAGIGWNWVAASSGGWVADEDTAAYLASVDQDVEAQGR